MLETDWEKWFTLASTVFAISNTLLVLRNGYLSNKVLRAQKIVIERVLYLDSRDPVWKKENASVEASGIKKPKD